MAGRAEGCQSPASSPVSATLGGTYGNTEGLGRGSSEPRSPRQAQCQGHNTEGKELQNPAVESRLDKSDYGQERDQTTKQLQHFSLLRPWDPSRLLLSPPLGYPTPHLAQKPGPCVWSSPRRNEEQTWPPHKRELAATARAAGPSHPGPTRMTTVRRESRVRKPAMSTQWWQNGPEPRKNRRLCR